MALALLLDTPSLPIQARQKTERQKNQLIEKVSTPLKKSGIMFYHYYYSNNYL